MIKVIMPVVIPRKLAQKDDLVVIPRKEYEAFLEWKEDGIPVVKPTKAELKAIQAGEHAIARGDYVKWEDLKNELDHHRRRTGKKGN